MPSIVLSSGITDEPKEDGKIKSRIFEIYKKTRFLSIEIVSCNRICHGYQGPCVKQRLEVHMRLRLSPHLLYCLESVLCWMSFGKPYSSVCASAHKSFFFSFTRLIDYGSCSHEMILSISNLTNTSPQKDCTDVEGKRGKGDGNITDEMRMLPVLCLGS